MLSFYLQIISNEDKLRFEQIYNNYKDVMFKKACSILKSRELSEDAVHNAFINIIKNLPQIYDPNDDKTKWYVIVVVENEAKKIYNREHKVVLTEMTEAECDFDLEDNIDDRLLVEQIKVLIEKLPDIYRIPMSLKYYNELSVKEIASALSISKQTIYKRLERGKALLLNRLKENERNE
ncbi:sigma-70 family RNA polymerase sigma factor [Ruminococcus sp.]|uniref:RNA polymerase sigma factor n=1 Tax=Ruminococcus sp. TaxID=41978 RepID=UPI00164A11FD|nr:sigma-70 family RNA polymerase sigma factor [Ruminococcus sp.]MBR1432771.1 sigma-70 family RNA polymerase sigma factor [Ruminococcus sp.]